MATAVFMVAVLISGSGLLASIAVDSGVCRSTVSGRRSLTGPVASETDETRQPMIIDCHGHYTTTPAQVGHYRDAQKAAVAADPDHVGRKGAIEVSDDEIRDSLEGAQLRLQRERGTDLTIFSPRASWMGHHIGNEHTSKFWTQHTNELIRRVCDLYPRNFAPVCALPQTPSAPAEVSIANSVAELRRCVEEMGFVGCNLNPDPSGGWWSGRPLDDETWFPLYEAMVELDVPAMIHVSATCNDNFHSTGSHYLGADTTAFMQAMTSGLFRRFPEMRWIIPHGGGAVPYHWGRFKGMAEDSVAQAAGSPTAGSPTAGDSEFSTVGELMNNIWFDTCVYHQPGIDLLTAVVPIDNILFASEMVGAVRGVDPETGHLYDDTKRYIDNAALSGQDRSKIFEGNTRRVFPRLEAILDPPDTSDESKEQQR
jgi:4-oxalmesaconate hydratase